MKSSVLDARLRGGGWAVPAMLAAIGCATTNPEPRPATGPLSPVVVTNVDTWVGEEGDHAVPDTLEARELGVWVLSPAGQWAYLPGHGGADGRGVIEGVPAGPFLLRVGTAYFASSNVRSFELGGPRLGSPDRRKAAVRPTSLSLDLAGLAPWHDDDRLLLFVPSVGASEANVHDKVRPRATVGSTSLVGGR